MSENALPYQEPDIVVILILTSFLLLLNVVGSVLDRLVHCGLIGQIFIGVAWGNPGAVWLTTTAQSVFVQLGYLGLILLVYEGGLSTSFQKLKSNLVLSVCVALTGICAPIGLSFTLIPVANATALQAFAAGAALCSTSLGTTLTLLKANGLTKSRLGVVLTSAAMLDDVVGLVVVQIISNLGNSGSSIHAATVLRPVGVSLAFVVVLLLLHPVIRRVGCWKKKKTLAVPQIAFPVHTLVLSAFVVTSSYAGTSNLFAAYLAGVGVSWYDEAAGQVNEGHPQDVTRQPSLVTDQDLEPKEIVPTVGTVETAERTRGVVVYKKYYEEVVTRLLKPLFFASIGFSIPISQMFSGRVVWRGVVYALLMMLGKMLCGIWLVRFHRRPLKAKSLYPAIILGSAMTARGEIGFLIAGIAQSRGIYGSSDLFLTVTWAIMLCTIAGPITVGLLTRRVHRAAGEADVLWGL